MTKDNCDRCGILMVSDEPQRVEGRSLLCVSCIVKMSEPGLASGIALQERGGFERTRAGDLERLFDEARERYTFSLVGKWRVYFNRHGAEPLMWCVSPEDCSWELAVRDVHITAPSETVFQKKDTADDIDGKPSAWVAVEGQLTIATDGHATIGRS